MADLRYRGLPFMAPLVPLVLSGAKTVTRRMRKPAEVGDLLWIREAWRTWDALDGFTPKKALALHPDPLPVVWYEADKSQSRPDRGWPWSMPGRYRHARFLPSDLARPWRGRMVSVEWVPAPPEGIDDDEAIREGARLCVGDEGPPCDNSGVNDHDDYFEPAEERWTLDGLTFGGTPRAAFLAGWERLHPTPITHCWRAEWEPWEP